ncbi:hypothetical protein SDC9_182896 [bioreactor metagenome]|uniref:Uncharacterized protein n=1 Tax=bioreactor metagenome TaxID=1076179 RepID=A0A645H8U9_9ZZZZ
MGQREQCAQRLEDQLHHLRRRLRARPQRGGDQAAGGREQDLRAGRAHRYRAVRGRDPLCQGSGAAGDRTDWRRDGAVFRASGVSAVARLWLVGCGEPGFRAERSKGDQSGAAVGKR